MTPMDMEQLAERERPIWQGNAYVTRLGEVVRRPRVLPQDRWLVSDTRDSGLRYRVYVRAGWLWRLLKGTRWRCVSGALCFEREYDAWRWVESQCVNRLAANDWHGVGYARHMQAQTEPPCFYGPDRKPGPGLAWGGHYMAEPPWVYTLYRNGPPTWGGEDI